MATTEENGYGPKQAQYAGLVKTCQDSDVAAAQPPVEQPVPEPAAVQRETNILVAIADFVSGGWKRLVDIVRAALIGTAPVAPLMASVIAVATVANQLDLFGLKPVSFWTAVLDLSMGWGAIAIIWALLGLTSVRRANTTTYCELATQLKMLRAAGTTEYNSEHPDAAKGAGAATPSCAQAQFEKYLCEIEGALDGRRWERSVWVLGTGYLSAWELIHRAHEALIDTESIDRVVLRARYDLLRLAGSQLQHYQDLVQQLEDVIKRLGWSTQPPADGKPPVSDPKAVKEARVTVATVRETLNEFLDENRAGLVRSRIQLACTTMNTGLIGYAMLWLALAAGLSGDPLIAAVAYFLVGAVVGLLSRLRAEFDNDCTIDDFGLSAMRHFAAPQLSGVAAVLGVGLLALTGVTSHATSSQSPADPLRMAFDTGLSPTNLVTAAIFGFTPSLLFDRLREKADTFKKNLRSTDPHRAQPAQT